MVNYAVLKIENRRTFLREYFFVNKFLYQKYSFGHDESLFHSVQFDKNDTICDDTMEKQKGLDDHFMKDDHDSSRSDGGHHRYLVMETCSSNSEFSL
jgi:hypothetical protein